MERSKTLKNNSVIFQNQGKSYAREQIEQIMTAFFKDLRDYIVSKLVESN